MRAEVSCPLLFEGNQFEGFSKRIFVVDRDYDPTPHARQIGDLGGDSAADYEVKIQKK
ncbi:general secretion pathway protein C [Ramlibacter sp. AW1]|uniref:General secretion pathway protein C n=1 Tax=Ramlibacter aurantiacus TaxID=2801330 RepID=A0A936ZXP5_9BURK|nr:general secretion pathway protein C [Ramlibacter aurantiacus]